jgi:hypothetical protein
LLVEADRGSRYTAVAAAVAAHSTAALPPADAMALKQQNLEESQGIFHHSDLAAVSIADPLGSLNAQHQQRQQKWQMPHMGNSRYVVTPGLTS